MEGMNVGGHNINNLRYADNTSLLALEEQKRQNLLTTVYDKGKSYIMEINVKKTKSMAASKKQETPKVSVSLVGTAIEQVQKMVYLGSITTEDGKSEVEIKRRVEIARNTFNNMKGVLSSRNISINTRMKLTKCYVWSTLLYGAETWTITKTLTKRIDAFEMWTYRWMLRISWKEHKSNEGVLNMMKTSLKLMNIINKRKCEYFGHSIRPNSIQRLLLEARIDRKRERGSPRIIWMDNIKDWLNLSYEDCIRNAENREKWRSITFNLLRAEETWWWWWLWRHMIQGYCIECVACRPVCSPGS